MESNSNELTKKPILNLTNITQLTTFVISITVAFSLVRQYVYYMILLHIPVFQYIDVFDIVFLASTGIFWALYLGAIEASNYVLISGHFLRAEKIFYPCVFYAFIVFIAWIGYRNDPVIEQVIKMPLRYWYYCFIPFIIYVLVIIESNKNRISFFLKAIDTSPFLYSRYGMEFLNL